MADWADDEVLCLIEIWGRTTSKWCKHNRSVSIDNYSSSQLVLVVLSALDNKQQNNSKSRLDAFWKESDTPTFIYSVYKLLFSLYSLFCVNGGKREGQGRRRSKEDRGERKREEQGRGRGKERGG